MQKQILSKLLNEYTFQQSVVQVDSNKLIRFSIHLFLHERVQFFKGFSTPIQSKISDLDIEPVRQIIVVCFVLSFQDY